MPCPLRIAIAIIALLVIGLQPTPLPAQSSEAMRFGVAVSSTHSVQPNLTYSTASGYDSKLDVYVSRAASPAPTLIFMHGGGWVDGSKEASVLSILPYLAMGWTVVNVEYRLARHALAPAAVEDVRCAIRYVVDRARDFNVDTMRVVLSGNSAGGHLALIAGMLPVSAGLDRQCDGRNELRIAAVVNWLGITDVVDLLDGPNIKGYAVEWFGAMSNREEMARRVSPLTYARPGAPPVISVHGDADPTVPYQHAVRLSAALSKAGVPNELVTIPGGRHGNFSLEERARAFTAIERFLRSRGIIR